MAVRKWKINIANIILSVFTRFAHTGSPRDVPLNHLSFDSIAIFSTTALGDFMLNTPAIHALRNRYPKADLILLSSHKNRTLVESCAYFSKIIYWDQKVQYLPSIVRQLRREKPQLAVLLHSKHPYDVACAVLSGCGYIIKDTYQKELIGMEHWLVARTTNHFDGHQIARKLSLVAHLGCDVTDTSMFIPCPFNRLPKTERQIFIGFQLGASKPMKMWPVERFIELARLLFSENEKYRIVIIGTGKERALASAFMDILDRNEKLRVDNYAGQTTLPELLSQIDRFSVLVTGDTGPLHLAVALKVSTVSLFAATDPKHTAPYQDQSLHRVISLPVEARAAEEDISESPLSNIRAGEVAKAVFDIIKKQAQLN